MITGHHRTDDHSPSELAWRAIHGHAAIAAAVAQHAEAHAAMRAERERQLLMRREDPPPERG